MLALDQRESMRDLLAGGREDADLRAFKETAASILASTASAILLDRLYGVGDTAPAWAASNPLILAADHFTQEPGKPVSVSDLDADVTPELIEKVGASAVKFLALWKRGDDLNERRDLVASFLDLAHRANVPAVLEGIVRPDGDAWASPEERDDAIVEAAAEFAAAGPGLYKAEVPGDPRDPQSITAASERITAAIDCPWVILSNGVPPDAFPDAVQAACAGGASGFLAGRAVWTQSAVSSDPAGSLATDALRRLRAMRDRLPASSTARVR